MSRNRSTIPDRWLDYTSVGKQIDVTPFLAFKVPLKDSFFNNVPPDQKFGPSELIEMVPNLSLVIDLTNTPKYYSGNDFINSGIQHRKIFCPGHQIPPRHLIKKFFEIVDDFMKRNGDNDGKDEGGLIGVHCTHGINRTGFFICSYMINKMGYNSEKAISEFNSARGHSIERENYLNALKEFDVKPIEFQNLQYNDNDTNSSDNFHYDDYSNDRLISQNSCYRRYTSESYGSHHHPYRPVRNYCRNTNWQSSASYYHQPRQRDFNFYDDHPLHGSWRNGNSRPDKNARHHPFVLNQQPALESVDPYFNSSRRSSNRNNRNRN